MINYIMVIFQKEMMDNMLFYNITKIINIIYVKYAKKVFLYYALI